MGILKSMAVAAAFFSATSTAFAVKAYPGLLTRVQSDGTTLTYRVVGDEHYHAFATSDGHVIRPDAHGDMRYVEALGSSGQPVLGMIAHDSRLRSARESARLREVGTVDFGAASAGARARRAPQQRLPGPSVPTTGRLRGVVLLVEFADNSMLEGHDSSLFHSLMNDEGYSQGGATGSARDYFIDQSMGLFMPEFDVFGPIKLKNNMMYYGANNRQGVDSKPGEMVKEACEAAESELGVDFSRYDYNSDGMVDFVYVIYAGYAESYGASSNTIWPHASDLSALGVSCTVGGKAVRRYACSSELKYVSGNTVEGIGTFCHEFSHVLGLPDIYNTNFQQAVQLGAWDVMDSGSYNNESRTPPAFSAFERFSLGWLELTELSEPAERVELAELTESNCAYRISTADADEFFTLENRQQRGWDAYQPGRGLMIIHIAYEQSAWDGNFVNSGLISRYDLVEADGTQGTQQSTDLYPAPGNDMFTDYSSPSSLSWDGTPTEKGVTGITDTDGVISFSFMTDRLARPVACEASGVTPTSFVAVWQPVDRAESYRLNLTEILPDSINPVVASEDFSLMSEGGYPAADYNDIGSELDSYMSGRGWTGSSVYQAGGRAMVGYYGRSGRLCSPVADLSACGGRATVAFRAMSYPGKSVAYTVSLEDAGTGSVVESVELKAVKTEEPVTLHFSEGTAACRLVVATDRERLFIDDLRLLHDSVGADSAYLVGPREWTVDSIAGTSFVVDGLCPGRTYTYTVEALSAKELMGSLPSAEIRVTTAVDTGMRGVEQGASAVVAEAYFDLAGRRVAVPSGGVFVRRLTMADGTQSVSKVVVR